MTDSSFHIEQFRQGNRAAFKAVFDSLYPVLCLFVNRFIHDLPASEDVAQEALLALWNRREEMESVAHIKSFLYLTGRRSALDYLKHQKIKSQYERQALEAEATENFEYFVIAEEVEQMLLKTEENLPEKCRRIFRLAMQGKDNETIASVLHISVNTVKTQKKIAYKKLKSYLSDIICLLLFLHKLHA